MSKLLVALGLVVAGTALAPMGATAGGPSSESQSVQKFVQDFYTWYLAEEKQDHNMALSDVAVKMKPRWFSAAVLQGLKEDDEAQAKSPGDIVGLDFDPFLNAQDICEPYKTGKVTAAGAGYRVEVFGSCEKSDPKQPDVIAAVEKRYGSWVFVDFYYPEQGDLFSVLEALKKERENTGK